MHKLKQIYSESIIIQYIISYFIVLVVSISICIIGFQIALNEVEKEIAMSYESMIEHSRNLIDKELIDIRKVALNISQNDYIYELSKEKDKNPKFFLDAQYVTKIFSEIYQSYNIYIVNNVYIYMDNSKNVLIDGTMYRDDIFLTIFLKNIETQIDDWRKETLNNQNHYPKYVSNNNNIRYIQPFNKQFYGPIVASVVVEINQKKLESLLSADNYIDKASIFIKNEDGDIIFKKDNNNVLSILNKLENNNDGLIKLEGNTVLTSTSKETNWEFIVVIPETLSMSRLEELKVIIISIVIVSIFLGGFISFFMAMKNVRPIAEIIKIFTKHNNEVNSIKNIGEMVSNIISKNQVLLEEMEREKPMLKQVFFQRIIRGEFSNDVELDALAKKIGFPINPTNYYITTFRIFPKNDFYKTDAQTIDEVRIISLLIQNKIKEQFEGFLFFYEIDYLTTIVMFENTTNINDIKKTIVSISEYMSLEYHVNQYWGISKCCTDLSKIWRSCEEAKFALSHGINTEKDYIIDYENIVFNENSYYYPDLLKKRIVNSVRANDKESISNLVSMIKIENIDVRKISRNMFLKLNTNLMNTISLFGNITVIDKNIENLNQMTIEYKDGSADKYFATLEQFFIETAENMQATKQNIRKELIDNMQSFILENYFDSNLGLSLVANKFNISEGYVSTVFKEQGEMNFADFVEKKRIDTASELLLDKSLTVNDISVKVGYNNVQSFRRAFKRVTGVSPSNLRN